MTQPAVAIRFSQDQRKTLEMLAEENELSFSEQVRQLLDDALTQQHAVNGQVDAYVRAHGLDPDKLPAETRRQLVDGFRMLKRVELMHAWREREIACP